MLNAQESAPPLSWVPVKPLHLQEEGRRLRRMACCLRGPEDSEGCPRWTSIPYIFRTMT